ncbi:MAG: twin transmembrane helix small protein [Gammaproteobacteria bacterium]|nr:twin transmembrane helix small protein [Gammaproteobacteria bacterium]
MLAKIVIIFILMGIFFALGSGLYYLVKEKNQGIKTVKALTWRIALTILLLFFLMFGAYMGWFQPNPGF